MPKLKRKWNKFRRDPLFFLLDSKLFSILPSPQKYIQKKRERNNLQLIKQSKYFDPQWYLSTYRDVANARVDPAYHYLIHGAQELRDPGPEFSTNWYIQQNPEVKKLGINPLLHFQKYGKRKGKSPAPQIYESPWWFELYFLKNSTETEGSYPGSSKWDIYSALERIYSTAPELAVIVPVYNAYSEVQSCLQSLVRHTPWWVEVILINDASSDQRIPELLQRYAQYSNIRVFENSSNLGYTRTVNRGIEIAYHSDVIVLNSDTRVTSGWIRKLRQAAYSGKHVATVTPVSNNAGAFSVPAVGRENPVPVWLGLDQYARAITQGSEGIYPEIPTGNGFCIYIRRDCLAEVGKLDAEAFPYGYGEENDFCMRAGKKNWTHLLDDSTLIYHVRGASFGDKKNALLKQGREILDSRYPEYSQKVKSFIDSSEICSIREQITTIQGILGKKKNYRVKPRILFVVSTRTGGTPQTNQDLMHALEDRIEAFLLRCTGDKLSLSFFKEGVYYQLESVQLQQELKPFPHRSSEYDRYLANWLFKYSIELVHIRHIAWHGLGLVDVAKSLDIPVVFSFHDYYTVCPTVHLLDEHLDYCWGKCTSTVGDCEQSLWSDRDLQPLKHNKIYSWKKQMQEMLSRCDKFVTTCYSAQEVILKNFPDLKDNDFYIIPHGRDFESLCNLASIPREEERFRIVLPGNISRDKGVGLLVQLTEVCKEYNLEIHILGRLETVTKQEISGTENRVVLHGPYDRDSFGDMIDKIRPHMGAILSIWPETYCHTLTELWSCGIPVLGFDFGAVGERIRATGAGWVAREATVQGILEVIEYLGSHPEEHRDKVNAVLDWQECNARIHDCQKMGHDYFDIYRSLLIPDPELEHPRIRVAIYAPYLNIRNKRLQHAPASTYLRLYEKCLDWIERAVRYDFWPCSFEPEILAKRYHAILVQRNAVDKHTVEKLLRACKQNQTLLFYECDDQLFLGESDDPEQSDYLEAAYMVLESADAALVSTRYLSESLFEYNSNIYIQNNAISERLWFRPLPVPDDYNLAPAQLPQSDTEIRAVYLGTKTHTQDLELLRDPVLQLRKCGYNLRLFVVGITEQNTGWCEHITIPKDCKSYPNFVAWIRPILQTMHVGVGPLQDTELNNAKSDLKFLEYSAAGLVSVLSDVVPYRDTVRDFENGLIARNNPDSWYEKLKYLMENPAKREDMKNAAYNYVFDKRRMQDVSLELDNIIKKNLDRVGKQK